MVQKPAGICRIFLSHRHHEGLDFVHVQSNLQKIEEEGPQNRFSDTIATANLYNATPLGIGSFVGQDFLDHVKNILLKRSQCKVNFQWQNFGRECVEQLLSIGIKPVYVRNNQQPAFALSMRDGDVFCQVFYLQ